MVSHTSMNLTDMNLLDGPSVIHQTQTIAGRSPRLDIKKKVGEIE